MLASSDRCIEILWVLSDVIHTHRTNMLLSSPSASLNLYLPIIPRRHRHHKITRCSSSMDPLTSIGRLLWGRSLPPSLLVSTVRTTWQSTWHLMMRQLAPTTSSSSYSRPPSQFPAVPHDYDYSTPNGLNALRLFASFPCPWAHRALVVLALTNLDSTINVSIAVPSLDGAWEVNDGKRHLYLKEVYAMRKGGYDGRATVPMLWDSRNQQVLCNDSYAIIQFFNSISLATPNPLDLAPPHLRPQIDSWNHIIYPNINNGVYRCGFAQSQEAYNSAVNDLFTTMDMLEAHLSASRYLCGDALTLADVCLFTTLIRFDLVYNVLFKCTKKKLVEYPNLHAYMRDIYQIPKVAATCNFEAIMDGYYRILFPLNPGSIRPAMPCVYDHDYLARPHNRDSLDAFSYKPTPT